MELDLEKIKKLYLEDGCTIQKVADSFEVSYIKMKNTLKKYNIRKNIKQHFIKTNCSTCEKEIEKNNRDYARDKNHFCSKECKYMFKKIKVNCHLCGKEKYISKSKFELSDKFFCDEICYKQWKKENSLNKCCICGKENYNVKKFKDKYYCKKHYNHMYRHGKILEYTIRESNEIINHENYLEIVTKDVKGNITGSTYIDEEDYDKIKGYKIYKSKEYARISLPNGKKKNLHNFIMGCPDDKMVDHIKQTYHDGNLGTLDNRKSNLRIATNQKNSFNMKKGLNRGIRKNKNNFSCHIMLNYKNIWLGSYISFEEAVIARMIAEILLFKNYRNICLDDEKIKIYNNFSKECINKIKNNIFKYIKSKNIEIDKEFYDQYIQSQTEEGEINE